MNVLDETSTDYIRDDISKLRGFSTILYRLKTTKLSYKALFALCMCVCVGGGSKREGVQISVDSKILNS